MALDIETISVRLREVDEAVEQATQKVENDGNASAALKAVVREFQAKSKKALGDLDEAKEEPIREHIVELEEGGDCAKAAAEVEQSISQESREAVLNAHQLICSLKSETAGKR